MVGTVAEDAGGRKKRAGTLLRAPMSLQKMACDAATGTVIRRSKIHAGSNFLSCKDFVRQAHEILNAQVLRPQPGIHAQLLEIRAPEVVPQRVA